MTGKIYANDEQEFRKVAESLHAKYNAGKKLNLAEIDFLCNALVPEERKTCSLCDEHRFRMLYFRSLQFVNDPKYPKLEVDEIEELKRFGYEWDEKVIQVENHSSKTKLFLRKEALKEISQMSLEFRDSGYLVKNNRYDAKLLHILYMSRFIHFKVEYEFFLGNENREILIPSSFGVVTFNEYSFIHILSRHYAAGVKQYPPNQGFFSNDVRISSVHRLIFLVLGWIQRMGIVIAEYLKRPISFKFKGMYYQLYLDHAYKQEKGHKGNIQILRVNTLFPVNQSSIIAEINTKEAHSVSKSLTIYEQ